MLHDKVVTGAGRGIGRAIAILAAQQGAKVVVNDYGGDERGEGADAIMLDIFRHKIFHLFGNHSKFHPFARQANKLTNS